jgi:Domain of unknown function (DUF4149)
LKALLNKSVRIALVLWAGSLWATALWFAPVLFRTLPDRHTAGAVAGAYFRIEALLTAVVAVLASWSLRGTSRWVIYLAACLLAINEIVLRAFMESAQRNGSALGLGFGAWHGISACSYLAACAVALIWWWRFSPAE